MAVALPKYIERKPYFKSSELSIDDNLYPLETAQNINTIAFKTLEDRMLRELGTTLLRMAVKQAAEYVVRKKSEGLGALLSVLNSITEKADTRNWQTLPYSIAYSRVPLPQGSHSIAINGFTAHNDQKLIKNINVDIKAGKTTFQVYHILETRIMKRSKYLL